MITEKEIKKAKLINYSCMCIVLLIVVLALSLFVYSHYRRQFTPEKWNNDIEKRSLIVGDFLSDYELVGMTKNEVKNLLGNNNNDYGYFNKENRYVYYLGCTRTIIDSEWLLIDFKDNIVVDYKITTD